MFYTHESDCSRKYANLGAPFVTRVPVTPFKTQAHLIHLNNKLAAQSGLNSDELASAHGIDVLSGQVAWPNYESIASVYCGHQFGVFVPQLGDGRALIIAEIEKQESSPPFYAQLQLKGAGPTPYSRHADGRAVLRSSIREYLASEAMHRLGIPTTRALSITGSCDPVFRETTETAAVVCRVAPSFLRFGHIEYFSHTKQLTALEKLLRWHIAQNHSDIALGTTAESFSQTLLSWFEWVVQKTAKLMALWQSVGFCHGVMNTDNMSLLGLTIDYGPYGFIDSFNIDHICNHSDHNGRYSYHNQPRIGHWNLYALAQALLPLMPHSHEDIQTILNRFTDEFHATHLQLFSQKLGLPTSTDPGQAAGFIEKTLETMHTYALDFTRFFRSLSSINPANTPARLLAEWQTSAFFPWSPSHEEHLAAAQTWLEQWHALQQCTITMAYDDWANSMDAINPAFVLRNYLMQNAIVKAGLGDMNELNRLFSALSEPYKVLENEQDLYSAPPAWATELVLSCSS